MTRWTTVLLISMAFLGSPMYGEPTTASCNNEAWLAMARNAPPADYEELAALPAPARATVAGALSPELQSQLWQQHLQRFVDQGGLDPVQQALVEEAMQLATPELFASRLDPSRRAVAQATVRSFEQRARQAFGSRALRAAFVELGRYSYANASLSNHGELRPDDANKPECNCRPGYEQHNCPPKHGCDTSAACTSSPTVGCGVFHFVRCTGMCTPKNDDGVGEGELRPAEI